MDIKITIFIIIIIILIVVVFALINEIQTLKVEFNKHVENVSAMIWKSSEDNINILKKEFAINENKYKIYTNEMLQHIREMDYIEKQPITFMSDQFVEVDSADNHGNNPENPDNPHHILYLSEIQNDIKLNKVSNKSNKTNTNITVNANATHPNANINTNTNINAKNDDCVLYMSTTSSDKFRVKDIDNELMCSTKLNDDIHNNIKCNNDKCVIDFSNKSNKSNNINVNNNT